MSQDRRSQLLYRHDRVEVRYSDRSPRTDDRSTRLTAPESIFDGDNFQRGVGRTNQMFAVIVVQLEGNNGLIPIVQRFSTDFHSRPL